MLTNLLTFQLNWNKRPSLINASYLLNAPPRTLKFNRRPGRLLDHLRYIHITIGSSSHSNLACHARGKSLDIVEPPRISKTHCSKVSHRIQRLKNTVEPPVATTSPRRPVFQNTKRYQVKSLYLEPLVSDYLSYATATTYGTKSLKFPLFSRKRPLDRSEKWITRCCNIIVFLVSTRNGIFSMGRTGFLFSWLTFTWKERCVCMGAWGNSRQWPYSNKQILTHYSPDVNIRTVR